MATSEQLPNRHTVLAVDSERSIHTDLNVMLAGAPDIELRSCTDAKQALVTALKIKPSVIIQDIHMNDGHGFDLLDAYRDNELLRSVPIIMLSDESKATSKAAAFERGANDYLIKMPDPIELIARIRYHSRAYIEHLEREAALYELKQQRRKLALAHAELERLASLDGLTNIANRRYFDNTLTREWARAMRDSSPLSIIMIDIDHFKAFNDCYGHLTGDHCLKQVSATLNAELKRPADFVARFGGEEFVALLPNTAMSGAMEIAERMRQAVLALQYPHADSPTRPVVSISLGVSTAVPQIHSEPQQLLQMADKALYAAKAKGRNAVSVILQPDRDDIPASQQRNLFKNPEDTAS